MRFQVLIVSVALLGLAACGASQAEPVTAAGFDGPSASGQSAQALPRYFSVTVSGSGLAALGQPLDEEQLRGWAAREASDPSVAGAAVTAEAGVSEARALAVIGLLVRSGFKHVVFSSRDGLTLDDPVVFNAPGPAQPVPSPAAVSPAAVSPAVGSSAVAASSDQPATPSAAAEPPSGDEPARVEVKQLGLHIGGGPNTEEAHARYSRPIQRRFGELERCYAQAQPTQKNASFGVDLLVPSRGGLAKIKDYRTVLGGKDFHLCVLGVFGSIEFPAPEKATVVSYSVLFKPL